MVRVGWIVVMGAVAAVAACNTPRGGGGDGASRRMAGPIGHVIIVTVDGMMPDVLNDPDGLGLKTPTLRALVAGGALASGARSVLPSVTYPAHATIATGVEPGRHGIVSNRAPDPAYANLDGWRWYAEDLKAEPLWERVEKAGGHAALVNWPVTVGARVAFNVPELWRAGTREDQKLVRALATPGVLDAVAARFPGFWDRFLPPNVTDEAGVDVAVHAIETVKPAVLFLHVWQTDDAEHESGPHSAEALAAFERVDGQIARLVEAAKRAGTWEDTVIVVTSDHGFAPIERDVRLGALLVEEGVFVPDAKGRVAAAPVRVMSDGGMATVYAEGAGSERALAKLRARLGREPWVGRILEAPEVARLGGDPNVAFAIEPVLGTIFDGGLTGPVSRARVGGGHGWSPERPEMRASFLASGPKIVGGQKLGLVALVDVAPTVGAWLGVVVAGADGRVLPVKLAEP